MRKQWRCFHCDEVFTNARHAAVHFGGTLSGAACQLKSHERHLVDYIRELEERIAQYQVEDSHVMRSIYSLEADHRQALIRAEEDGYNKGVSDMRKQAERAVHDAPSLDENGYIFTKAAMLTRLNS